MMRALAVVPLCFLAACSVPPAGSDQNPLPSAPPSADQIRWPARYEPDRATFFVHNEIEIDAPPQEVWDVLIRAETWPEWYRGAENVKVIGSADGRLGASSEFSWRTMDLNFTSRIIEFDPPHRLSWESRKSAIQGYHAWLLIPTERGTRLVTDESQFGVLAWLQGISSPANFGNCTTSGCRRSSGVPKPRPRGSR